MQTTPKKSRLHTCSFPEVLVSSFESTSLLAVGKCGRLHGAPHTLSDLSLRPVIVIEWDLVPSLSHGSQAILGLASQAEVCTYDFGMLLVTLSTVICSAMLRVEGQGSH